jgi:uncharacterized protein YcgI (DUF1989 family)
LGSRGRGGRIRSERITAMKLIYEKIMPPKTGLAIEVKNGQHWRVIDLEGR